MFIDENGYPEIPKTLTYPCDDRVGEGVHSFWTSLDANPVARIAVTEVAAKTDEVATKAAGCFRSAATRGRTRGAASSEEQICMSWQVSQVIRSLSHSFIQRTKI